MDDHSDWLDSTEERFREFLRVMAFGKIPDIPELSPERAKGLSDLFMKFRREWNPLNLDLPGNPREPWVGEVNYPYPEVYRQRYGKDYKP